MMQTFVVHKLWSWLPMAGITFGKHVFLKDVQDKLTLEHELVHVSQQAEHGLWFWLSYLVLLPIGWNPWRRRWEGEAYAVQAKAGCPIDGPNGLAQYMAGAAYGWCCREKDAALEIRRWMQ